MHATFVADKIWGDKLEPTRRGQPVPLNQQYIERDHYCSFLRFFQNPLYSAVRGTPGYKKRHELMQPEWPNETRIVDDTMLCWAFTRPLRRVHLLPWLARRSRQGKGCGQRSRTPRKFEQMEWFTYPAGPLPRPRSCTP